MKTYAVKVQSGRALIYDANTGGLLRTVGTNVTAAQVTGEQVQVTLSNGRVQIYSAVTGALQRVRDHDFWSRFEAALTDKEFRELPPDMVEAFKDYGVFWIFAALFSDYKETSRLFEPVHQHHKQILMMLWSMMIKTQDANSRNVAPGYLWALLKNRKHIATFKRALYRYLDTPMDANALLGLLAECATRNRPSQPSYGSMHDAIVWMEEPWFLDLLTAKRNGWFTTHEELVERVRQRPLRSTTPPVLEAFRACATNRKQRACPESTRTE